MKIEPGVDSITILSNNSNVSSPLEAISSSDRSQSPPSLDIPDESLACTSRTSLHLSFKPQSIVVEYLKKLCTSKGSRNAFKRLDYNIVKHLKVDYLLLVFNNDVVLNFRQLEVQRGIPKPNACWIWTSNIVDTPKQGLLPYI